MTGTCWGMEKTYEYGLLVGKMSHLEESQKVIEEHMNRRLDDTNDKVEDLTKAMRTVERLTYVIVGVGCVLQFLPSIIKTLEYIR